jgi:hypothetical protein
VGPSPGIRAGASLLLFLAGFLATAAALRTLLPAPAPGSEIAEKLAHLAHYGERYDTLFVGSSRTRFQIDPDGFDRALARLGWQSRSFNLGVNGMRALEVEHLLREVLRLPLPRLRFVFVDPGPLRVDLEEENAVSARAVAWHGPLATLRALRLALASEAPLAERAHGARRHLTAGAWNLANLGRGAAWLDRLRGGSRAAQGPAAAESWNGYEPLDRRLDPRHPRFAEAREKRRDFEAHREGWLEEVRALAQERPRPTLRAEERGHVARLVRALRERGVQPILFVAPTRAPTQEFLLAAAREGIAPAVLYYSDPAAFPELYAVENRFDLDHLNERGARQLTALLARDFAALRTRQHAALGQPPELAR